MLFFVEKLKVLIKPARDHSVIKLADLVSASAVKSLKVFGRGQHVGLPRRTLFKRLTDRARTREQLQNFHTLFSYKSGAGMHTDPAAL